MQVCKATTNPSEILQTVEKKHAGTWHEPLKYHVLALA